MVTIEAQAIYTVDGYSRNSRLYIADNRRNQTMQQKHSKDLTVNLLHQSQPYLGFCTVVIVGASRFMPRQGLLYTGHNRSL